MSEVELSGARRAAAFLLSLAREEATEVLRHLPDDVIGEVAQAMTELDPAGTPPERVQELYRLLASRAVGPKPVLPAAEAELVELLAGSIGDERAAAVVDEIRTRRRQERPFAAIEGYPPGAIAGVLQSESPAVAALVLSHLDPAVSAAVLSANGEDRALDVVQRMASLKPPGFTTLSAIAADLEEQLALAGDAGGAVLASASARLQSIAEMLSHTGAEIEQTVLQGLESLSADVAAEIREFMFTWEDLATVDQRAMQKILSQVNTKTLSIALKACPPTVEKNVLSGLSERVREMVREERELAGPMPMSEVQVCRDEIMQAVRALMDSGEFRPRRAGEDLVE